MALEPYRNEIAFGDKSRAIDLDVGRAADIGDTFRGLGKKAIQVAEPILKDKLETQAEAEAFKTLDAKDADGKPIRVKAVTGGSYFRDRHDAITGQVHMDLRMVEIEEQLDIYRKEAKLDVKAFGASAQGYMAGILKTVDPDLAPEMAKRISQEVRQRALGLASEVRTKGTQAEAQMLAAGIKLYRDRISDYRKIDPNDARIAPLQNKITTSYSRLVAMGEAHPEMRGLLDEADAFEVEDIAAAAQDDLELAEEGGSIEKLDLATGTALYKDLLTNPNNPIAKKLGKERLPRYMQRLGSHLSDLDAADRAAKAQQRRDEEAAAKEVEQKEKVSASWLSGEVRDREALDIEFGRNIGAIDKEGNLDPAALTNFMRRPDATARLEPYIQRFKGQYLPPAVKNWLQGEMASGNGARVAAAVGKYNELTGWVGPNGETYGALLKQREFTPEVNRAVRRYAMLRAQGVDQETVAAKIGPIITKEGVAPIQPNAALKIYQQQNPKEGANRYQGAVVTALARAFNMPEADALRAIQNDRELLMTITGELDAGVSDGTVNKDNMDQAIGNAARGVRGLYSYSPHIFGGVSTSNWGHNNFQPDILDRAWEHSYKTGRVKLRNPREFRGSFSEKTLMLQPPGNRPPGSAGYGQWKVWRRGTPGTPPMVIGVIDMDFFTKDAARRRDARAGTPSQIKAFVRGK